jgi:sugar (pentulose or hexulose) kinase
VGPHTEVVLSGGWSRNPAVAAAKRRQFAGARTSELGEAGAVGAAYLGAVAAGLAEQTHDLISLIPHGEEPDVGHDQRLERDRQ